jgi:nicotinate-nucleotide--dimethylbenzimidazole phosphoribosyltransferase
VALAGLSGLPLDDIRNLLAELPPFAEDAAAAAAARQQQLYHPVAERGRLAELPVWLAGWQNKPEPAAQRIELALFAGAQGWLSPLAQERARDDVKTRILLLSAGGAPANPVGATLGAGLKVFDLAVDRPVADIATNAAMSERDCVTAIAFGMEAVAGRADLLCVGAFGVGTNETAAALAYSLYGGSAANWLAGRHLALSLPFAQAQRLLEQTQARHADGRADAVELLRRLGGRDIAAVAGAIIAARTQRVPVLLDGFAATVAAAILAKQSPGSIDHCLVAARDGSAAHDLLLEVLGIAPVIDVGIQGGDGLAALLAAQLLRASVQVHRDCATRDQVQHLLSDSVGTA